MSTSSFCFIGPQEIIVIIFMFTVPAVLVGLVIFALLKYINKSSGKSKRFRMNLKIN
jgi:hypothetical protein